MYRIYRKVSKSLEHCFCVETAKPLSKNELKRILWLIAETFEPNQTKMKSFFETGSIVEIGPCISIETAFSSNRVEVCHSMEISAVERIECVRRYRLPIGQTIRNMLDKYCDRMTEQYYPAEIESFDTGIAPEDVKIVDLIGLGKSVLEELNKKLGLGMDKPDMDYYYNLFVKVWKRNPTDVELFQLGNANSEHSRHWYFKGRIAIDGMLMRRTLFEIVQEPLKRLDGQNCSLVAFRDNAGVIRGFETDLALPIYSGKPSGFEVVKKMVHITCTAETHNHPTFISPFPGAATGVGGRIRDNSAVGRGGVSGIGAAGYFVGNLFIPRYKIPGEEVGKNKPSKYASPLSILIEGSDGASCYHNEFGEPLTLGFTRTFGQIVDNEWREPRKPILYSGGVGHIFDEHLKKEKPEIGMLIARIGGPAYPIGVGGGSASSMTQGQNTENLDFNSVQRGNPQMKNKVNRVIRECVEMGEKNPISSIHDQGAGGPSNVLTELLEPLGGNIDIRKIILGDKTMSVLQIWSAEFQEGYGLLIKPENIEIFQLICRREDVNCEVVGEINGSGKIVVEDSLNGMRPVDLNLEQILTKMPQKNFESQRRVKDLKSLELPKITVGEAIKKVFKLPSVGSKGFLTRKADRSVTGLVAGQQCCGIEQIPIADNSVNAQSHFGLTGTVSTIGEQPIITLIDPKVGARMAVGEMLTNMAGVKIRSLKDIRCRANWIWPVKMPYEGAQQWDATVAMSEFMIELGMNGLEIAPDGGKDSLTPVAKVKEETVKSPGSLVVLGYAPVSDITKKVTPDIKEPGKSLLGLIDLGLGKNRLGGSALAQVFNQIGDEPPDPDIDAKLLVNAFLAIQKMVDEGIILALHDRSGGGLITSVAEMCMASRCGFSMVVKNSRNALAELFSEELGFVIEIRSESAKRIFEICDSYHIPFSILGLPLASNTCFIGADDRKRKLFKGTTEELRLAWESTSYQIERLQTDPVCAKTEYRGCNRRLPSIDNAHSYRLSFIPKETPLKILHAAQKPKVAVLREKGTNGDREMIAALIAAGLDPWSVKMSDLVNGKINLDKFQGVIFPGGFSNMDVFGSAKGWAGTTLFSAKLREMFNLFYAREDTFSLGVCNGCQYDALVGLVPFRGITGEKQPRFVENISRRFESRWIQVEILKSPSLLLNGMEGSRLGVWIAHGEGRLIFPDPEIHEEVIKQGLAPIRYLDPYGNRTEEYPYNPNGSPDGIAALCSPDGRHLAMMPHPERCFRLWQWPWMPSSWESLEASPWLRMFQNARIWCLEHKIFQSK